MKPRASIIIPVFDDADGLICTLESLRENLRNSTDIEIIVCNDGGGEKISSVCKKYQVFEAVLPENKGRSAARNRGLEFVKGDIIAFLDADQTISPNWLSKGIAAINKHDYIGGKIEIYPFNRNNIWEIKDRIFSPFPVKKCIQKLHFAPTANLFIRKEVIDKVGVFDERLRSSEDVEFGQRIYQAGFSMAFSNEALSFHPARKKAEQIRKMKRLGRGAADKYFYHENLNPYLIALYGFSCILKLPLELGYRSLSEFRSASEWPLLIRVKALFLDKYCKLIINYNIIQRSLSLRKQNR